MNFIQYFCLNRKDSEFFLQILIQYLSEMDWEHLAIFHKSIDKVPIHLYNKYCFQRKCVMGRCPSG